MTFLDPNTLPPEIGAALRTSFGDADISQLASVRGGLSGATVLSFVVDGVSFVVRKSDLQRSPHGLRCFEIASARGVAPPLRFVDHETGVCIMERIESGRPAVGDANRVERVARSLRHLHEGPMFPRVPSFAETLQSMPIAKGPWLDEVSTLLAETAPFLAPFAHTAPCHHDVNPGNILVTDTQVFLVDWDTAGQGDPFVDLAQFGVFATRAEDERARLLEAYLGRSPDEEERAHWVVARVVAVGMYAVAFLYVRSMMGDRSDLPDGIPMGEMLATLGAQRERVNPGLVAASMLREMRVGRAEGRFREAIARPG